MKKILFFTMMIAIIAVAMGESNYFVVEGPSGGLGGVPFSDGQMGGVKVTEVRIRSGEVIDALQFMYGYQFGTTSTTGPTIAGGRHGGKGGSASIFTLRDGEYITEIVGKYNSDYICSITIKTNLRTSPTYGGSGGDAYYDYMAPPGWQIVGFNGRSSDYINAIGVTIGNIVNS